MFKFSSVIEKVVLIYVVLLTLLGSFLAIFNQVYFDLSFSIEDGLLEWLQFLGLITISAICFRRVFLLRKERSIFFIALTFIVACFFVFASGEEISWGQRLFNIKSSEFFAQNNVQGETNLHNLMVGKTKINKLIFSSGLAFVFTLYLVVITPLYVRSALVKKWVDYAGIPIPTAYQVLGYIFIIVLVEGIVHAFSATGRRGELTEFAAIYLVMLNVAFPANPRLFTINKQ